MRHLGWNLKEEKKCPFSCQTLVSILPSSCSQWNKPNGCSKKKIKKIISTRRTLSWQRTWRVLGKEGAWGNGSEGGWRQPEPQLLGALWARRAFPGLVREGESLQGVWKWGFIIGVRPYTHVGSAGKGVSGRREKQSLKRRRGGHIRACWETPNHKHVRSPKWNCVRSGSSGEVSGSCHLWRAVKFV